MTGKHVKALALALIVVLTLSLSIAIAGKKTEKDVTIDQVPAAVKTTILKEAGSNTIEEIEEVSKDGKVIYYEAEWETGGKEIEITVDPEGKLLSKEVEDDDDDDDDDDD
ncbi:MAG: PepSY domain-containing protein [Phycisphaerae bacterium]|jgi:hypothetical protein|nr:PepSY domain-containing protein [Phycisphaerae bacterium]